MPFEKSTNVPALILPVTASPDCGAVKVIEPVLWLYSSIVSGSLSVELILDTVKPTDCPIPIYFPSLAFCKTILLPELTAWIGKLEDIPINEYDL